MKTILFVDGPRGPRHLYTLGSYVWREGVVRALRRPGFSNGGYIAWENAVAKARRARFWWMVECANAEDGRHIIVQSENYGCPVGEPCSKRCRVECGTPPGRIVAASDGTRATEVAKEAERGK